MPKRNAAVTIERKGALEIVQRRGEDESGVRLFRAVVSTADPVPGRLSEREVLSHDPRHVDLKLANAKGIPVRAEHEKLPIGRAWDFRIDGDTLYADRIEMAPSAKALEEDIARGFITDVSVGARVAAGAWVQRGEDLVAEKWRPAELSLTAIGADERAQILRKQGDEDMSEHDNVAPVERAQAIETIFAGLEGERWLKMELDAVRSDDSLDVIRGRVTDELKRAANESPRQSAGHVQAGDDALDKYCDEVERSLAYRSDLMQGDERRKYEIEAHRSEYAGLSMRELAREYLRVRNLPVTGTVDQVVDRALFTPPVRRAIFSHTTSDFANLLAANSDKALGMGYVENPETYGAWTRNKTVNNFRAHQFHNMSTFGALEEIPESGTYTQGPMASKHEEGQAREYGRNFAISRQMVVNDDLNAFTGAPAAMGRAAARKVGDLVYSVLTTNANMNETGRALFNTTDGNTAASGAAPDSTQLGLARKALRTRRAPAPGTGETGAVLNTVGRYLLAPAALETSTEAFLASQLNPAEGVLTSFQEANIWRNQLELIIEPRLDDASATAWYLLASRNAAVETVSVLWLNGIQRPTLSQVSGFDENGGIRFKVRIDAGAVATDWRGMYKDPGA